MKKIVIVIGIFLLSTISIFSGCVNESTEVPQFLITSFDVKPSIINLGETANLSWVVTGATSVFIDNGVGSVAAIGFKIIEPTQTTTYTLTASNTTATKNANVTITVNIASNETIEPIVISFQTDRQLIEQGESANLSWAVTGATFVSIDNGVGNVALTGIHMISPTSSTTYTLSASNSNTTEYATVIINVDGEGHPPIPPP